MENGLMARQKNEIRLHVYKKHEILAFVSEITDLIEERAKDIKEHNERIAAAYARASRAGFHTKPLRKAIAKKMAVKRELDLDVGERECLNHYCLSLGLEGTPLGEAADKRAQEEEKEEAPSEDHAAVQAVGRGNRSRGGGVKTH
jgi:uncharacterized protein (UPF0335 family)